MGDLILVTGAAGRVGGVGRIVTELLLKQGKAVRAMVRNEDERAQALRDIGAEVVVGDLLDLESMHRVIAGCGTMYFGMSVSDTYLTATVNTAAVAKHYGVKAFVNMSQMTVSQMSITESTESPQHKLQWLAEQALNWSGLPIVHIRPTLFLEGFLLLVTKDSVRQSNQIRLPFGEGKTSPVGVEDVARVIAEVLEKPQSHIGNLPPDRSAVRKHEFLCPGVFESAWPHHHLSGHSSRAVAGRAACSGLACSLGEASRDHGGPAPRRTVRPDDRRRADADGAATDERSGIRQKK